MCGISGVYKFTGGEVGENELIRMGETLAHRGPDSGADYISPDKKAGLSQRRLAIIDLAPVAACPMAEESGKIWITFNGEIYNFKELREELLAKGHVFKSHGDTETILHGYEEYGPAVIERLNGMFAFAIFDENKGQMLLARDHVGVKPLYYAIQNGVLYFGSEIKAILANPAFKKEFEEANASLYLTFGFLPAPHTLFRDVKKIPAAHYILITKDGALEEKEYWNPLAAPRVLPPNASAEEYIDETRRLLEDSIQKQMISDVPFGCLLSGGIDSSLNAALMSRALGKPVETFTIGAEHGERYNEFEYSRKIAEFLGAAKHERLVSETDFVDFLENYGKWADDPNADTTCFLVFYLSGLVRDSGVTVIQTGEGGDELFAGYGTYKQAHELHGLWKLIAKLPGFFREIAAKMLEFRATDQMREFARRLRAGEEPFWGHAVAFSELQKKEILAHSLPVQSYDIVKKYYADIRRLAPGLEYLNRIAYLDLKTRLADFLLMRVDKMGMAHSIEARVPFLDRRIVELALQIPARIKMQGELKHVLKEIARGVIPDEIIDRKKQGFGAPVEEWLRNATTGKTLRDKVFGSSLKTAGLLNYEVIEKLWRRHEFGENHTFRLMTIISLSLWYDYWFSDSK
jgi:asparagine synthase (glutamine-hydrolysing)